MSILLPSFAYAAGLVLALWISRAKVQESPTNFEGESKPWFIQICLFIILVIHGMVLQSAIFKPEGLNFGFADALSLMAWFGITFYWIENWFLPLRGMLPLVLGMGALFTLFSAMFPGELLSNRAVNSQWFRLHFFVANAAYGLMSLAALHAILMSWQDKRLRHHANDNNTWYESIYASQAARWLDLLPPLMTMERVLFNLLRMGYVFLTLTVFSGIFFSQTLFGRSLIFDHKTVFALIAWLMFGGLLIARWRIGLRGVKALRWVLTAFLMLMLAYVGSRFVLEVLLHRV